MQSVEQTLALGEHLGRLLTGGDIIALSGELGTGKTVLARGIVRGLGLSEEQVNSPTFTLIQTYDNTTPVIHADLYRLENMTAIFQLGLEDYFTHENILIIEWAERLQQLLPSDHLAVRLTHGATETSREVTLQGNGPRSTHLVTTLIRQNLKHHLTSTL